MTLRHLTKDVLSRYVDARDVITGYRPPQIIDAKDAVQVRALVRWGDGETTLASGRSTPFQAQSQRLASELTALLNTPRGDVLLCFIPDLVRRRPFYAQPSGFRRMWALTALMMRRSRRRPTTAHALMFRQEGGFRGLEPLLDRLQDAGRVVIVSANPKDAQSVETSLTARGATADVTHIQVPKVNAYETRDRLLDQLTALSPAPDITLLSAGPVGKCLIPHLLTHWPDSSQIVDTGHLFDHLEQRMETPA